MISVIIPLYNKEKYIKETIQSVLNQTYKNFELIIVNDGSTDGSLKIVDSILDERIKVIRIENGGVSNARNTGIKNAKFEWIALLDADDEWETIYLENAFDLIQSYNITDVVATNYYLKNQTGKKTALKIKKGFLNSYFNNPCITSSSVIINKRIFNEIGIFNEILKYGEDQHLWFRIASKYKIYFNDNPLVNYRLDDHNFGNKDFSKRDINTDLVCEINKLEINHVDWLVFKEKYLLKYLKPYYICDNHFNTVTSLLKSIKVNRNNFFLMSFYLFPRFIIKPLYKVYFFKKYT